LVLEISNFALEIYNTAMMKRYIVLPWISAFLLFIGFSMVNIHFSAKTWLNNVEGILMIIIGIFGVYQSITAALAAWRGDPMKDELTRKVRLKASSQAFYISIWCWIGLMFADKYELKPHSEILGTGVLFMAGAYIISSIVIRIRGLRDE